MARETLRVQISPLSLQILISCPRSSTRLSGLAPSTGGLPGSMRVRTLASAPRRARSRHTSVAPIANGLPLLIPHQVSHYDVFLGILAFDVSAYLISVTIVFFCILCPQFPITQLIAITVSLNIC